jgi:sec-independent protein translocase protein TatA
MMLPLALIDIGFGEMVLIAIIALLLYGSDLPTVARTWGKAYQEFRRHLNGIKSELNDAMYAEDQPRKLQYYPEYHDDSADVVEAEPMEHDSPVARAAEEAEKAAAAAVPQETPAAQLASEESELSHDAHGAA